VTHTLLVLHRHALLNDRDKDVLVRSSDQLRFRRDTEESYQSQRVSGLTFSPTEQLILRFPQRTHSSLRLWSIQER
jgi:hypothetical protein